MKILLAAAVLLAPMSLGAATLTTEAARGGADAAFSSLAGFKAGLQAKSLVSVSGNVNLSGTGNLMPGSTMVFVTLSGYGTVQGDGGRVTSNYTNFSANVNCTVSGGWIYCNDYPNWWVDFYKDGKLVGQGTVRGSINTQVYAPNGFFTVNTFTYLSGSVSVPE